MALKVKKLVLWGAEIGDQPGAAGGKLRALSNAGVNLQFVFSRRQPDRPGSGIIFAGPIQGGKEEHAAKAAGFLPATELAGVILEGPDKKGMGTQLTEAIAKSGVNLRGFSAHVVGKQFSLMLAFDSPADAEKGLAALKKKVK